MLRRIASVWPEIRNRARILRSWLRYGQSFTLCTNIHEVPSRTIAVLPGYTGYEKVDLTRSESGSSHKRVFTTPEVRVLSVPNVSLFAHRRFNAVYTQGKCVIPARKEPPPWDFGPKNEVVAKLNKNSGLTNIRVSRPRKNVSLKNGIYVGARAPDNYYHWLINALPSLFVAQSFGEIDPTVPALIPASIRDKPNLQAALDVILGGRTAFYWERDVALRVREAFIVDPPPIYDTPLSKSPTHRTPLYCNVELMKLYRDALIQVASGQENAPPFGEKLFLVRKKGDPRMPNYDALIDVARKAGFSVFCSEDYSFADQVRAFRQARFIAGPGGASFTNLLFCQPGARAILWKPRHIRAENPFANLAAVSQTTLVSVQPEAATSPDESQSSPWWLSKSEMREILESCISGSY